MVQRRVRSVLGDHGSLCMDLHDVHGMGVKINFRTPLDLTIDGHI
jgi:hypothetical protein